MATMADFHELTRDLTIDSDCPLCGMSWPACHGLCVSHYTCNGGPGPYHGDYNDDCEQCQALREQAKRTDRGVHMTSVLQDWVVKLGLRHQGVLLTAVRGPDTAPKEDAAKSVVRAYRAVVLNAFCHDPRKATSFIEYVEPAVLAARMQAFASSIDHYPLHWFMHLLHAVEIVGYKHPDPECQLTWGWFYRCLVHKLHLNHETETEMDERLNAPESTFAARSASD